MDDDVKAFIGGLVIGAFLISPVYVYSFKNNELEVLVKNCEKELPRNQHCKLIAVPDTLKETKK